MAQLRCKCGAYMTKTDCPSPCSLNIFYKKEVDDAIRSDSDIMLHNFLSGWDEKNDCKHTYMNRTEPVDYWFCPTCKRVYEVQNIPHGHWLRIYKRIRSVTITDIENWIPIYVMPDVETDAATEEKREILLSDYLKQNHSVQYILSPDEKVVCAIDSASNKILYSYKLEDIWPLSDKK